MRLIDLSPTLHAGIAVWPGDTTFRREVALSIAGGSNIDLSSVHTTVHVGAHADAPSHYAAQGVGIDQRPLERYFGPCQVFRVPGLRPGERIRPEHLSGAVQAPRVLLHTGSFPDPDVFREDFCSLSPELVHHLADRGVVLVGIDTPSIDPFDSKALESHQAVAARDLAILEGLLLEDVAQGLYTLIALPLKLKDADASPVRAVLVAE